MYEDLENGEQIAGLPHRHVPSPGPNILCQQLLRKLNYGDNVHKDGATFVQIKKGFEMVADQTTMFLSWSGPLAVVGAQQRGSANIFCQLRRHFSRMFGCG